MNRSERKAPVRGAFAVKKFLLVMAAFFLIPAIAHAGPGPSSAAPPPALTLKIYASPQITGTAIAPPKTGTAHQTVLTWTASTGVVVGYNVYKATSAGGEQGSIALNGAAPITGTSFTDTTVVAGQTAYYVVTSQNAAGEQSAWSNEVSGTTPNNPASPQGAAGAFN